MESAKSHRELGTLPEEVIITIFEYLCFEDRRNSRLVCKNWNEILSSHKFTKNEVLTLQYKFHKSYDRTGKVLEVILNHELITWDMIGESRPFHKITLKFGWFPEHSKFYSFIGEKTKVLEIVEIEDDSYLKEFDFEEFIKCFPKLETLIIDFEHLEKILLHCPKFPRKSLKHVHVPRIEHIWNQQALVLLRDMKKVTADSVLVCIYEQRYSYSLDDSPIFILEEEFNLYYGDSGECFFSFGDLNLAKHQTVKLSDVKAIDQMPIDWFHLPLEKFDSLEKLHVVDIDDICAHVQKGLKVPMPSVREVNLGCIECHKCLKALVSSFPKADKWTITFLNSSDVDLVEEMFCNITYLNVTSSDFFGVLEKLKNDRDRLFQKLEKLHIGDLEYDILEDYDWAPMPRLQSLELRFSYESKTLFHGNLAKIISATPSIREFVCCSVYIDEEDIRAMAVGWPYLTHLRVSGNLKFSKDEAKIICKNLKSIKHPELDEEYCSDESNIDEEYSSSEYNSSTTETEQNI